MRPRIGITTSTLERAPEGRIQTSSATHVVYARCIHAAGGLPFLLPNLPHPEDAAELLGHLDGLLLSGGGDIDPHYIGEPPHPALGVVDRVRDDFEVALVRAALARDLPLLGICRGVQVLAVATGGDIWQDIPSQVAGSLVHRQTTPRHQPQHPVEVQSGSLLARAIWPTGAPSDGSLQFGVNSFHHQAPRNCGRMLAVVASSPDGLVEGLAAPEARFALGVQWHPEEMAEADPRQARLFTALVEAARGR